MSEKQHGRVTRFRRWLAYKLLPGTNEFDVATSRQLALFHLRQAHGEIPDIHKSNKIKRASQRLSDDIVVRGEWDNSDELRLDNDE